MCAVLNPIIFEINHPSDSFGKCKKTNTKRREKEMKTHTSTGVELTFFLDEGFVWLAVGRVCSNVRREHSNTHKYRP